VILKSMMESFLALDLEQKALSTRSIYALYRIPKKVLLIFTNTNHYHQVATVEENNRYKDSLLSSISHELRTPLNGTLSCLQAALNDKRVPKVIKETLIDPALRSGKLLLHTINDILDYSLVQSQELSLLIERKSIIDTLTNAFKLCEKATAAKGIDYILNLDSDIPVEFTTDHERLSQVVLNLLTNALKFTFKGAITLKASWIEDSIIEISVQDTGIGMSQVEVDALLEEFLNPFQSPSRRKKSHGIGLGLKICNHLISYLGPNEGGLEIKAGDQGSDFSFRVENKVSEACLTSNSSFSSADVEADEKEELRMKRVEPKFQLSLHELCDPQDGNLPKEEKNSDAVVETLSEADRKFNKFAESYVSCFRIESPFFPGATKSRKRTQLGLPISSFNEGEASSSKDILVVDDDPINILGLRLLLNKLKLSIDVAYNGQQAVEKVQSKFKLAKSTATSRYKLIFMDCQMPIMDGYEASRVLTALMKSAEIPETTIIGCTAFTAKNKLDECLASGMSGVITKPIVIDKLKNIIKKHLK